MIRKTYKHKGQFILESGKTLYDIEICYHISEEKIDKSKPVVWICHALTANSNPEEWWSGLVGNDKLFNLQRFTIICANILGSCYGSTSALSINPETGKQWLNNFPLVTVRDWVKAHDLLREHLGIEKVFLLAGGSIGGFQAVEWAIEKPARFENLMLIATSYISTPWAIAINETERMAIEADATFYEDNPEGGKAGLAAARGLGLLSYRRYETYNATQSENSNDKLFNFRASSYQRYQGQKLVERFNAHCYHAVTRSMDTHNVARNRVSAEEALSGIKAKAICVGISSDILFPPIEQKRMGEHIPNAIYTEIDSEFGHDGFLIENDKLSKILRNFLNVKDGMPWNSDLIDDDNLLNLEKAIYSL